MSTSVKKKKVSTVPVVILLSLAIISALALLLSFFVAFILKPSSLIQPSPTPTTATNPAPDRARKACIDAEGKWLQEYNECEGLNQKSCEELGGSFEECASACRHDPKAELCIAVCVNVCKFN